VAGVTTIEPGDSAAGRDEQSVLDQARAVIEPLGQRSDVDMDALDHRRRLLLVHAHPDDESIGTGASMAKYASEGALVTLVTCTMGEEGEIVVPELGHLAADRDDGLGRYRVDELAVAMDPNGGYGHPDHIQAHRVTMAAVEAAAKASYRPDGAEPWEVAKVYWTAVPKSVLQAGIDSMRDSGHELFEGVASADDLPFGVPDERVTTQVDATDHLDAKLAALRAHASQVSVDAPFFALSNKLGQKVFGIEHFQLVRGPRGPGDGPDGWETDLFAGIGST
jgi:N-acetyl-1-D-myo-inositol-2-amino-2-deoxy-alpha-D-glucopyranoside deacetylase